VYGESIELNPAAKREESVMTELNVVIGAWYQAQGGQMFEVVALDPDDGAIEIQYFEGEVEELDFDTWEEMVPVQVEAPEDWSGAYEAMEQDDMGYSDAIIHPENWGGPLKILDNED
jgi:hypothetical protein